MDAKTKENLKQELVQCLGQAREIRKITIFGSFLHSDSPNDMDIAIFQDSDEPYLPLALKYRRMAWPVSNQIPLDIIPLCISATGAFMDEIERGEVIYEQ